MKQTFSKSFESFLLIILLILTSSFKSWLAASSEQVSVTIMADYPGGTDIREQIPLTDLTRSNLCEKCFIVLGELTDANIDLLEKQILQQAIPKATLSVVESLETLSIRGAKRLSSIPGLTLKLETLQRKDLSFLPVVDALGLPFDYSGDSDEDIVSLSKAKNLRGLELRGDMASVRLDRLRNNRNLRSLALGGDNLQDRALEHLDLFPSLEVVGVNGSNLTDQCLVHIGKAASVKSLNITSNQITDDGMRHLANLVNLHELRIESKKITGEGFRYFTKMTDLHSLSVRAPLTRNGICHIKSFPKMSKLDLKDENIKDDMLICLKGLSYLTSLDISFTGVKGSALSAFPQLIKLDASFTKIDDKGLLNLVQLKHLKVLNLHATEITNASIDTLAKMKNLETIGLESNQLDSDDIGRLSELTGLKPCDSGLLSVYKDTSHCGC